MTLGTPALWAGSAVHPIRVPRNAAPTYLGVPMISHANSATATTRGGGYGVAGGGDLAVTTTGGLGYSIAAGRFALPGTFATAQGGYVDYNDAAVTGTLPARDASNPYIAYICARVRDTDEDATGSEVTDFAVVQGTPNASPAAPAVPSSLGSLLILSEALVPSVANGGPVVFTERRKYLAAVGGIMRVTSASRPTGAALWEGLYWDESDRDRLYRYNGSSAVLVSGRCNWTGVAIQSMPPGFTNAVWTTEVEDTDGFGSVGAAAVQVPTGFGGKYYIAAFATSATGQTGNGSVALYLNGSTLVAINAIPPTFGQATVGRTITLAAGDNVVVQIGNSNAGAITFTVTLEVVYLGP